jgi:phosphate:Na+ symporter
MIDLIMPIESNYLQILLGGLSALILFIYAVDNLSKQLQQLASRKFHKTIGKAVKNKYVATLIGAGSTAVIQSSSAVTVMTIILVNTGIIPFTNSLAIILGSNIGTTVTAQLALLNSTLLASILIIVGFLVSTLSKKLNVISKPIFFLGFILFSLSLLSNSIAPLRYDPNVVSIFAGLSSPLIAYAVGAMFTGLVQSSSVTSGIVVILTSTGIIPVEVAIPIMLGANLGSSITGLLASSGLNLHARRVGFANFMFNAIGTFLFMIFLPNLIHLVALLSPISAVQVALAHLIFNVINTIIFLIFIKPFEKLIVWIIKGTEKEILFKTKFLNGTKKKKVSSRIEDIEKEIAYSIENTIRIYQKAISVFYNPARLTLMNINKLETLNDYLDDEITDTIVSLTNSKLDTEQAHKTVVLIKISNTIEQLGDLGEDLAEVFLRMHKLGINPIGLNIERLTGIHSKLILLFREIKRDVLDPKEEHLLAVKQMEEEIYQMIREEFDLHVSKLQMVKEYDGNIFVDAVSIIELSVSKVRDIRKILLKHIRDHSSV